MKRGRYRSGKAAPTSGTENRRSRNRIILLLFNLFFIVTYVPDGSVSIGKEKPVGRNDAILFRQSGKAAAHRGAARIEFYEPHKISNAPGYIVTNPKSPYFSGVTYSGHDSGAGVDLRTPPELLYRDSGNLLPALFAGGQLKRSAVEARKRNLVFRDMNLFVQECGDRDGKIIRALPEREKGTFCRDAYLTYMQQKAPEWIELLPDEYKVFTDRTGDLPELKSIRRLKNDKDRTHLAIEYAMKKLDLSIHLGDQLKDLSLSDEAAVNSARVRPLLEALFQAIEVAEGVDGKLIAQTRMKDRFRNVRNLFRTLTVDNSRPQASDLVNSQDGNYLNPQTLAGIDTSVLNPRSGALWKWPSRPISKFDTRNYDAENTKAAPEDIWKYQDDNPIFLYDDIGHGRGHNAKFHVKRYVPTPEGKFLEEKFKLKFEVPAERVIHQYGITEAIGVFDSYGQESMTPVAASNLAAALGFSVEPVFFKKKVRVLFPPEGDEDKPVELTPQYCSSYNEHFDDRLNDAVQTMNMRFGRDPSTGRDRVKYPYLKSLRKRDVSGCYVLEIPTVNITPSIGAELKTNSFIKEAYGRQFKRAYRAMQLFYALVYDIDSMDYNATVNIVGDKVIHKAADIGSSFGWFMARDSVNDLSPNFVKAIQFQDSSKKIPARVVFTYRSIELNPISSMVTLDDAKWFARLAGQLSGNQIRQAFLSAGYIEDIANQYASIMVRRINQMIAAVGVEGTQALDAEGKSVTISLLKEPGAPSNGHFVIEEFKKCFDPGNNRFICIPEEVRNRRPSGELSPEARQIDGKSVLFGELITVAKNNISEVIGKQLLGRIDQIHLNNSSILTARRGSRTGSVVSVRPVHLTMPNPFADPEAPVWSVDIFTLRIGAQALSEPEANALGLRTATLGSGAFIARNVIHIHPTRNAFRKQLEIYNVVLRADDLNPFHKLARKSLDMMVPGDIVVMVDQLGIVGSTPSVFTTPVGMAGSAGIKWTRLRQFVAMKPDKNGMAVSWLDGKALEFTAAFGRIPFIAPLVSALYKQTNTKQDNYYFHDWSGKSDHFRDIAVARFAKAQPPDADDPVFGKYRYEKRVFKRNIKSWTWSLFGFKGKRSSRERIISTRYMPNIRNEVVDSQILSSIRLRGNREDISLRPLNEDLFRVQSAVLNSGLPILRINADYSRGMGSVKDFESLKTRHLRLLPAGWIAFDAMDEKERFIELEFHAEFLITEEGFKNIIEKAQKQKKKALYEGLLEFIATEDLAGYKASGDSADAFADRLKKVVQAYFKTVEKRSNRNIEYLNDAVTNLIYVKQFSYAGLKYLLKMAGEENYAVHARLYKDPGFPNGDAYLLLPDKYSGRLPQTTAGRERMAGMMDVFHHSLTSFDVMLTGLYQYLVDYLPSQNVLAIEDGNRYNAPREFPIITPPNSPATGLTKPAAQSVSAP